MKYIDAEKLIANIKFAKSVYSNPQRVVHGVADAFRQDGRAAMCDDILKELDSLQQEQPEVDIVTEYDEQFDSDPVYGKLANRNAGIAIARHFYDLGCRHAAVLYDDIEKERQRRCEQEPTIKGWVARDKNGKLNFFRTHPKRITDSRGEEYWIGHVRMKQPNEFYSDLTWESEPIEVELLINRINVYSK